MTPVKKRIFGTVIAAGILGVTVMSVFGQTGPAGGPPGGSVKGAAPATEKASLVALTPVQQQEAAVAGQQALDQPHLAL